MAMSVGLRNRFWSRESFYYQADNSNISRFRLHRITTNVIVTVLTLALATFFLLMNGISEKAYAEEENNNIPIEIAIAYDNSKSMLSNNSTKWNTAKYSLEVLAAMMNPNDSMALFTMSNPEEPALKINGSQKNRVQTIHDTDLKVSTWTEHKAAQEAFDYLCNIPQNAENSVDKYLVITTDGAFNHGSKLKDVQKIVDKCSSQGITAIFLAIGDDTPKISSNGNNDVHVVSASPGEILTSMNKVSNIIFGRDSIPGEDKTVNPDSTVISLDAPMSEIIVFAQGKDVSVSDAITSNNGETVGLTQKSSVRYSDPEPSHSKCKSISVDENLQGVVCTFNGNIKQGSWTIPISGAESVEVYYTPNVGVNLALINNNGESFDISSGLDNALIAGEYSASYQFIDLNTGDVLQSKLLENPIFSLQATSNAGEAFQKIEQNVLQGSSEKIKFTKGVYNIRADAIINESARATPLAAKIIAASISLDVSAVPNELSIANFAPEYPVKAANLDGTLLTQAEWDKLNLAIEDTSEIQWNVEKTNEVGTFNVKPTYIDNDEWTTQSKLCGFAGLESYQSQVSFKALDDTAGKFVLGEAQKDITYTPNYLSSFLRLLPWIILLLIIAYFIYKYLTKPRLPRKMEPSITFDGRNVPLKYPGKNIKNKWSPWGPETISFGMVPRTNPPTYNDLKERFYPVTLELIAVKKDHGKRKFVLSDTTLRQLANYSENYKTLNGDGYPNPSFSGVSIPSAYKEAAKRDSKTADAKTKTSKDSDGSSKKAKKKGGKISKTNLSKSSTITFKGYGKKNSYGRKTEERYTLRFKKQ